MSLNITLRLSASWSETLFQWLDAALDRIERLIRAVAVDEQGEFGQAIHDVQIRRLAAHGCSGQALI